MYRLFLCHYSLLVTTRQKLVWARDVNGQDRDKIETLTIFIKMRPRRNIDMSPDQPVDTETTTLIILYHIYTWDSNKPFSQQWQLPSAIHHDLHSAPTLPRHQRLQATYNHHHHTTTSMNTSYPVPHQFNATTCSRRQLPA